jgi:hypothetical protein
MAKEKTMMRVDKELLAELKECKICKGESYANVVKRIMKNNEFVKSRVEAKLKRKIGGF